MVFFLSESHAKLLYAYAGCVGGRDWHKEEFILVKKVFSKGIVKNKNIALPIKMELTTVCKHINVQLKKHYLLSTDNI